MNVITLVKEHLKTNKFDGLVDEDCECGCELSELQPCDSDFSGCRPAYKHMTDDGFVMSEDKDWKPNDNNNEEDFY